eukprot:2878999-Rhodomonas_salina.2
MTAVTEDDIRREQERAKERSQERAIAVRRANQSRALSYSDYLRLDRILDAQLPQSMVFDQEVHDEMLFIIIHQTCGSLFPPLPLSFPASHPPSRDLLLA